ncbi:MAG: DegT/DnrJ/EryC1/StrS family aminotransferase [Candidatus Acidiferrales bacterium]
MTIEASKGLASWDAVSAAHSAAEISFGDSPAGLAEFDGQKMDSRSFSESLGENIFTFWKGRVALFAILKALGIGSGDHVVIPGFTCFILPSAISFAGAEPLYADVEPSTFNLSLETIEAALHSRAQSNVKAIVIQHTFGMPADTERIVLWARRHGIATIEDCAHALGSGYYERAGVRRATGTLSDAAFFSSHWNKPVSTGIGGWALVNDPKTCERVRRFWEEECVSPKTTETFLLAAQVAAREILTLPRIYWLVRNSYYALYSCGLLVGSSSREELRGEMPSDYAKRMSPFQEWLLKRRLARGSLEKHRRWLKQVYDTALRSSGLPVFNVPSYADPVLLRYPIRVRNKSKILVQAKRRGVEIGEWYTHPVDKPEGMDSRTLGYGKGMCPEGERASREVIHFPMGPNITEQAVLRMVDFVKDLS